MNVIEKNGVANADSFYNDVISICCAIFSINFKLISFTKLTSTPIHFFFNFSVFHLIFYFNFFFLFSFSYLFILIFFSYLLLFILIFFSYYFNFFFLLF